MATAGTIAFVVSPAMRCGLGNAAAPGLAHDCSNIPQGDSSLTNTILSDGFSARA